MRRQSILAMLLLLPWMSLVPRLGAQQREEKTLWKAAGFHRGICVVSGQDSKRLAMEVAQQSEMTVYVQFDSQDQFRAAAEAAEAARLLGRRIFVFQGSRSQLNLADNLADLVLISGSSQEIARDEILRVLRPGGTALVGQDQFVKPIAEGTDDWSHPYHGPDNNPQSTDQLARAPYLTHFLSEPWYSPMPLVTVAAGGRLFKAFGHVAIKQREWPLLNTLVAQNAFNGTILWKRPLSATFMIHRNTMIATPDMLLLGDDDSCKCLDTATGELKGEIKTTAEDGAVWKWMAVSGKVLYALVGPEEPPDPTVRGDRRARGWPWGPPLGAGYNSKQYPWGFGQTILAFDIDTKSILWRHRADAPIDTRAMCMAAGRIFFYSHQNYLAALDASSGKLLWQNSDDELLKAIGQHRFAQNPREGFSTSAYVKCNDKALYFAGPIRSDLVAVSAESGKVLWRKDGGGNCQLVLREDGLYSMGVEQSAKFDYLTGELLASLGPRVNCTRATGSADSLFVRGGRDGTMRYDLVTRRQQHLCPMRPSCQDGVIVAHGHLFWGPWMCDCNLTLVGVVSLAPAGEFSFPGDVARNALEVAKDPAPVASLNTDAADWPTLRHDNQRTSISPARLADSVRELWRFQTPSASALSAPTAVGDIVFVAGRDGAVRAIDASTGRVRWISYTAGEVSYPPSIWDGRAFVGSADGYIYCLEATSGRQLWKFRAAPIDRIIPVYGSLASTWPVASGVLVEQGAAYAAAGRANHDGTYVFALDARGGTVRWHNHSSGSLDATTASGVSVNGHLLSADQSLYLAGGNMVPVAAYTMSDGQCRAGSTAPNSHTQFTAGSDLYRVGDEVFAGGPPLYFSEGDYRMVNRGMLSTPFGDLAFQYGPHDGRVALFAPGERPTKDAKVRWTHQSLNRIASIAVAANAVLLAGSIDPPAVGGECESRLVALNPQDGGTKWSVPLPGVPSPWGLLIDRQGRAVVTLRNGIVVSLGEGP